MRQFSLPYPPAGAPAAGLMPTSEPRPTMTPGRAALIQLLAQYSRHALGDATLVEAQKLAYFLQVAGEQLRLDVVGHHYGPYADALQHVLVAIESHCLSGFLPFASNHTSNVSPLLKCKVAGVFPSARLSTLITTPEGSLSTSTATIADPGF